MFDYFYHGTVRKTIVAFANLFNDIHIARYDIAGGNDAYGNEVERIKVPIAYGPRQKFLRRLERIGTDFDQAKVKLESYLPRLSFEMQNITYDASRKLSTMNSTVAALSSTQLKRRYERVPYNIDISLSILAKNTDDALQIFEQIIPYFQPEYSLTVNMNDTDPAVSVPVVFKNAVLSEGDDGSQGDYGTRKVTIMTLTFVMKIYMYGPIKDVNVIRKVETNVAAVNNTLDLAGITSTAYGPSGTNISVVGQAATGATGIPSGSTGQYTIRITNF
jgi:hypothetical protein